MTDLRSIKVIVVGALAMLLALTMPGLSSATFTSSSSSSLAVTSGTWAVQDSTPPTVTLTVPTDVSGTQTVTARATDNPGGTGVRSVTFQTRLPNGRWEDRHTSTSATASWSWNTRTMNGGYYDVRATATDGAGNEGVSGVRRTLVLNGTALVMTPPAETISGFVSLRADVLRPDDPWLWWSLSLQYRPVGGSADDWTTIGLPNVNTHSISRLWSTYGLTNGDYELRAVRDAVWPFPSLTSNIVQVTVQNPRWATATDTAATSPASDAAAGQVEPDVRKVPPVDRRPVDPPVEDEPEADVVVEPAPDEPPTHPADDEDETVPGDDEEEAAPGDAEEQTEPDDEVVEPELRGIGIDVTNGGAAGSLDEGDAFTFTYSGEVDLSTVLPGWSGEATPVSVRLRDGAPLDGSAQDDTLDVRSGDLPVELGQVHLGADVIDVDQQILLPATMTAQTVTVDGAAQTTVTVALAAVDDEGEVPQPAPAAVLTWTPSSTVTTSAGRACVAEPVTQTGGSF